MLAELSGRVDHDLCCNSSEVQQPHHGRVNGLIRRWTKPDHFGRVGRPPHFPSDTHSLGTLELSQRDERAHCRS
jgi:hypothetical protein